MAANQPGEANPASGPLCSPQWGDGGAAVVVVVVEEEEDGGTEQGGMGATPLSHCDSSLVTAAAGLPNIIPFRHLLF